jgi:thiol-disulfide isomerase/thioredoxin
LAEQKKSLIVPIVAIAAVFVFLFLLFGGAGWVNSMLFENNKPASTFTDSGKAIEKISGKPVVRLFSTTWCPHCNWIKGTFGETAKKYVADGNILAYHWQLDTGDDTLTDANETKVPDSELAVFKEFAPGGNVPLFVFGGKYYRIGNGYEAQSDLAAEKAEFERLIESLLKQ